MNLVKSIKIISISLICLCISSLGAWADQNRLSAIEIKNSQNGYQILLKSDKATVVRKTTESSDDVTLVLKGVTPIEAVGTVYNNVPEIENVIIEPVSSNNTKVTIHGPKIATASVAFEPTSLASTSSVGNTVSDNSGVKEIELNAPIQSYAPTTHRKSLMDEEQNPGIFPSLAGVASSFVGGIKPVVSKLLGYLGGINKKILAFGALCMLVIIFGLKTLKFGDEDDSKIGLSQSLKERELDMKDDLSLANELSTLRGQRASSPKNTAPSINYGLKAYQNSQKNPYTSQISGLPKRNASAMYKKPSMQSANSNAVNQAALQRKLQQVQTTAAKAPVRKAMSAPNGLSAKPLGLAAKVQAQANNIPTTDNGKSVDSLKFLESMTKIYERSGRADLANELKTNIQRVQLAR